MEFLELIIRCAFKGLDLALRAGTGEKSYANWSIAIDGWKIDDHRWKL